MPGSQDRGDDHISDQHLFVLLAEHPVVTKNLDRLRHQGGSRGHLATVACSSRAASMPGNGFSMPSSS